MNQPLGCGDMESKCRTLEAKEEEEAGLHKRNKLLCTVLSAHFTHNRENGLLERASGSVTVYSFI